VPVSAGSVRMQALSFGAAPAQTGHVGLGRRLIDEDQSRRVPTGLQALPADALASYVRAVLLAGPERLFLYVRSMSASA
jgi:hypothetical protein